MRRDQIAPRRSSHEMDLPVVAIIGRPNVGKSTLFNRILGHRSAIVDDVSGVTRDRIFADCTYQQHSFRLVDTGGLDPSASDGMSGLVRHQSLLAIAEADVLVLVVDGRAGLTGLDEDLVKLLRETTKPVFVAVNKIDHPTKDTLLADFYGFGAEALFPVSAEHGLGVDELLEAILPVLPSGAVEPPDHEYPRIAVVGRPNVGKSTLVNTLCGEERILVSETAGTTRDPIDTWLLYEDRRYVLTDTAGIRRRGRIDRGVEGYSVTRAMRRLGRADIAVLVMDGVEGITEQDAKIAGLILRQGRGCVVVINKWDLRRQDPAARKSFASEFHRRLPFLDWAPVLYGSAQHTRIIHDLMPHIDLVMSRFVTRIPTGSLNTFLQRALAEHPLPVRKGKPVKSVFMTQVAVKPPTFALFTGRPHDVSPQYLRFLENRIRKEFSFVGTPLRILVRKK